MKVRSKAPLRLGFGGGGTDLASYCNIHTGHVLNATINMYVYCTLEELNEEKIVFNAQDRNESIEFDLNENFVYDGFLDIHKKVYERVVANYCEGKRFPIAIYTHSEAPAGSGLGSSSTLVVAILKAFVEYLNLPLGEYEIAHLAVEIERKELQLSGGKQDQYATTFGGFNFMEFYPDDKVIVNPLRIKNWIIDELESSLVLYNTGISRESAKVIDQQSNNIVDDSKVVESMHRIKKDASALKEALLKGDIASFAQTLGNSWVEKKKVAESITNSHIDMIYEDAMKAGAYAGKISGAGGGGFMMLLCDPKKVPEVVKALEKYDGEVSRPKFTTHGTSGWRIY